MRKLVFVMVLAMTGMASWAEARVTCTATDWYGNNYHATERSRWAAERDALAVCEARGGYACRVTYCNDEDYDRPGRGSYTCIARDRSGQRHYATEATRWEAERDAMMVCEARDGRGCYIEGCQRNR